MTALIRVLVPVAGTIIALALKIRIATFKK
jgi:hypothetical protein